MSSRTIFFLVVSGVLGLFVILPIIILVNRSVSKKIKIIVAIAAILGLLLIFPVFITINCFVTNGLIIVGGEPCPPGLACINDFQSVHVSVGECIKVTLPGVLKGIANSILKIFR
ncbi:MAG: hypothetical protein NTX82_07490 [Candidatus Parcubacteria bacterium]|nr:hypothetical protein [Candidatus Parcubacteria bacterium]